jgi:hypothetical protein
MRKENSRPYDTYNSPPPTGLHNDHNNIHKHLPQCRCRLSNRQPRLAGWTDILMAIALDDMLGRGLMLPIKPDQ